MSLIFKKKIFFVTFFASIKNPGLDGTFVYGSGERSCRKFTKIEPMHMLHMRPDRGGKPRKTPENTTADKGSQPHATRVRTYFPLGCAIANAVARVLVTDATPPAAERFLEHNTRTRNRSQNKRRVSRGPPVVRVRFVTIDVSFSVRTRFQNTALVFDAVGTRADTNFTCVKHRRRRFIYR